MSTTQSSERVSFYSVPETLPAEIEEFAIKLEQFRDGKIEPGRFRAIRVPFGVYEQRKSGTYMIRIRATAGGITPTQLKFLSTLAARYGNGIIHLTTRQEVQIHEVLIENIINVVRALPAVGLSSRGGGGNTIRNVAADVDSGLFDSEVFDVVPWAVALSSRLIAEEDSWTLPRKLKLNFSADSSDRGQTMFTDLGFLAVRQDGKTGFRVYVAGGMGARSAVGKLLFDFVEPRKIHAIAKGVKTFFHKHGNRKNKFRSRIRFLYDEMGGEKFMMLLKEEIAATDAADLAIPTFDESFTLPSFPPVTESSPEFELWKERNVRVQKSGSLVIRIPMMLGDITAEAAGKFAAFLENFGENNLRISIQQNFYVRNFPSEYAGNLYVLLKEVSPIHAAETVIANSISCTGADTCKLGITLPRNLTKVLHETLRQSDLPLHEFADLRINVSGCPNSCGQHVVADIGFFGRAGRKNGRLYPAYNIVAGGIVRDGAGRLALKGGDVSAKDLPAFLVEFLRVYLRKKGSYPDFASYIDAEGLSDIKAISERYGENVPTLEENPDYYVDYGLDKPFSMAERSEGECSAGIIDMINSDRLIIKEKAKEIQDAGDGKDPAAQKKGSESLFQILLASSRMLLVTRGSEPSDPVRVLDEFAKHFIDSSLIAAETRELVDLGKRHVADPALDLRPYAERIQAFASTVEQLYETMDSNFQFSTSSSPSTAVVSSEAASEKRHFRDLRTVKCPMNFVHVKVELSRMPQGALLEVLLDDGEPVKNVPESVRKEGHEIVSLERRDGGEWSCLIRKK